MCVGDIVCVPLWLSFVVRLPLFACLLLILPLMLSLSDVCLISWSVWWLYCQLQVGMPAFSAKKLKILRV